MPRADPLTSTGIIGLVVEFVVAIDEARVRFTDDAKLFGLSISDFLFPDQELFSHFKFSRCLCNVYRCLSPSSTD